MPYPAPEGSGRELDVRLSTRAELEGHELVAMNGCMVSPPGPHSFAPLGASDGIGKRLINAWRLRQTLPATAKISPRRSPTSASPTASEPRLRAAHPFDTLEAPHAK